MCSIGGSFCRRPRKVNLPWPTRAEISTRFCRFQNYHSTAKARQDACFRSHSTNRRAEFYEALFGHGGVEKLSPRKLSHPNCWVYEQGLAELAPPNLFQR